MSDFSIQKINLPEITPLHKPDMQPTIQQELKGHQDNESFTKTLTNAVNEVNQLQLEADAATKNLVLGQTQDIHGTLIAMEKANVSFQLLMEIRSKIIGAYKEVMRMNV